MIAAEFVDRLDNARRNGSGWTARCPSHDDRSNSLSIHEGDDGRVLLRCHAGCETSAIVAAMRLTMADLFTPNGTRGERVSIPSNNTATVQRLSRTPQSATTVTSAGCTLEQYAEAKRLPVDELIRYGLSQIVYQGVPAVRIPYRLPDGTDGPVQFRLRLHKSVDGDDRFRWRSGSKSCLYGLWRLAHAHAAGCVVLVEGASDCHTLWHHGIPALGLPGANNFSDARDAGHFERIETVYVVVEPDTGGEAVKRWLATAGIRDRVRLIELGDYNDPSDLHIADPDQFPDRWQVALTRAVPWTQYAAEQADSERQAAWELCRDLAREPRILDTFADGLTATGYAGDTRVPKLLYLALTSRRLDRPVSAVVKGPSSGGKSYAVERTAAYFPESAYYALSGMSERALAYGDEPLSHRMLIVYEAAGMAGEMQSYLLRSLLSEGRIRYETVEKTSDGIRPRLIEREGPTGVILTTTAVRLHPENETRLLSIPVADTPEQTRAVLRALAMGSSEPVNFEPWRALQTWLDHVERRVAIPFAATLVELIPPVAVRLRRDIGAVLNLIRAHALLHQAIRDRDDAGQIVATLNDYAVVRELVVDLVSEGVEATVSATVRQTVAAVAALTAGDAPAASVTQIAKALNLDKGAASRRVAAARDAGYLVNLEDKKGRPARLVVGSELPDDLVILPDAADLLDGCSVAVLSEGEDTPLPPLSTGTIHTPDQVLCSVCNSPLPTPADRERGHHSRCAERNAA